MSDLQPNTFVPVSLPDFKCPECSGPIEIAIGAWETETGEPVEWDVQCSLGDDDDLCWPSDGHRYLQSDWQPINNKAEAWGRAQGFRVPT